MRHHLDKNELRALVKERIRFNAADDLLDLVLSLIAEACKGAVAERDLILRVANDAARSLEAISTKAGKFGERLETITEVRGFANSSAAAARSDIKSALSAMASVKFGCHCDLEPGMKPDGCLIDENRRDDCIYARRVERKEQCEYWQPVTFVTEEDGAAS